MNFFKAEVVGKKMIEFGKGSRMTIENIVLPDTGSVVVGIRPEKMRLFSEKRDCRLRLEIELVEKLGAGELLYSHIGDQEIVVNIQDSSTINLDECWKNNKIIHDSPEINMIKQKKQIFGIPKHLHFC